MHSNTNTDTNTFWYRSVDKHVTRPESDALEIQSVAHSSLLRSQLHWFTMSTSLMHHVRHVGQTIHADSFGPTTATGTAMIVGGLPSVSLPMTHLSIKWKRHNVQARALLYWCCCQRCDMNVFIVSNANYIPIILLLLLSTVQMVHTLLFGGLNVIWSNNRILLFPKRECHIGLEVVAFTFSLAAFSRVRFVVFGASKHACVSMSQRQTRDRENIGFIRFVLGGKRDHFVKDLTSIVVLDILYWIKRENVRVCLFVCFCSHSHPLMHNIASACLVSFIYSLHLHLRMYVCIYFHRELSKSRLNALLKGAHRVLGLSFWSTYRYMRAATDTRIIPVSPIDRLLSWFTPTFKMYCLCTINVDGMQLKASHTSVTCTFISNLENKLITPKALRRNSYFLHLL